MKKILTGVIFSALLMTFFFPCRAVAKEARAVILFMQGEVKIKEAGSAKWIDAKEGMALYQGDGLKTGPYSWAEMGLGENFVRIQQESFIEITALSPADINLLNGELRALVEKLSKDETFKVKTPVSVCGVRGTGWDTGTDGKTAAVDVYENSVYFSPFSGAKGSVLGAGKRGLLEGPLKPILIKDVPAAKMRGWAKWKKNFIRRMRRKGLMGGHNQNPLKQMFKGKEAIFEQRDQGNVEKRLDGSCGSGIY